MDSLLTIIADAAPARFVAAQRNAAVLHCADRLPAAACLGDGAHRGDACAVGADGHLHHHRLQRHPGGKIRSKALVIRLKFSEHIDCNPDTPPASRPTPNPPQSFCENS